MIGSIGLILVMTWFLFVRRRELGIIKAIKNKVQYADRENHKHIIEYLFHSAAFSQVFNNVVGYDNDDTKIKKRKFPSATGLFIIIGTVLPILIMIMVLGFDIYETYAWKLPKEKTEYLIPNEIYYSKYDIRKLNNEFTNDSIISNLYNDVKLENSVQIDKIKNNNGLLDSEKKILISRVVSSINEQIQNINEVYLTNTTFIKYLKYRKITFEKINEGMLRFSFLTGIYYEVIIFRTIIPLLLIFICILIYRKVIIYGMERNEYFNIIQNIYLNMNKTKFKISGKYSILSKDSKVIL